MASAQDDFPLRGKSVQTILDNRFATLVYHPRHKIVHHTFHTHLIGSTFRDVLTEGLKLLKLHGAERWLSNDKANSALHPDDAQWAMEVWSKRAIAAGWKYWAIVMPDAALGRANMKQFIKMYADRGVTVEICESVEEALSWLQRPTPASTQGSK